MGDLAGGLSRRDFMKTSAGTAMSLAAFAVTTRAFAAGSDGIRVGVIGCGGRGSGAASDCLKSSEGVKIVGLADAFDDQIKGLQQTYSVPEDRCFVGLDAYQKLLGVEEINLVILAAPPAFRPSHFTAAIAQGKHVFMEKPVAVCLAGVNEVIEAAEQATQKRLAVVAGTQRRHDPAYIETMKRIQGGAIGEIISAQCYWNTGGLWHDRARQNWDAYQSGKYSDIEWQLRNWLFSKWLSGDHIVEQHIHNIDVINWAFGALPDVVHGMGGRQARTDPMFGNIYDHFGIEFVYPGDVRTMSMCRQIDGATNNVSERVVGTQGWSDCHGKIEGENTWTYEGEPLNPYVQEHADLIRSVRAGEPLNEGKRVAESTLCAIMARESAYARRKFKRSYFIRTSTLDLRPSNTLTLSDARRLDPVPIPGQYKLPGWPEPQKNKG